MSPAASVRTRVMTTAPGSSDASSCHRAPLMTSSSDPSRHRGRNAGQHASQPPSETVGRSSPTPSRGRSCWVAVAATTPAGVRVVAGAAVGIVCGHNWDPRKCALVAHQKSTTNASDDGRQRTAATALTANRRRQGRQRQRQQRLNHNYGYTDVFVAAQLQIGDGVELVVAVVGSGELTAPPPPPRPHHNLGPTRLRQRPHEGSG